MKKIIILLVAVLVCSCGDLGYLVSYSVDTVSGKPEKIQVTYLCSGFTYNETVTTPWTYKTFCVKGDHIGVTVYSESKIDLWILYKKQGTYWTYDNESGIGETTIHGEIKK